MLIDIQCPNCSSILSVPEVPEMERKFVTCPACKQRSRFNEYKRPNRGGELGTQVGDGPGFELVENTVIGQLVDTRDPEHPYKLKEGSNVIGRKASSSTANIQIPMPPGDNRFSRDHLLVEVKQVKGKGIVHYLSLNKEKVNETKLNGSKMNYGETFSLKDKDMIQIPGLTLRFEMPNAEATEMI